PRRCKFVMTQPSSWLPVTLFARASLGMLWAAVSLASRFAGFSGFVKLLLIPLLLMQFSRSERGMPVLIGFLASCALLLLVSGLMTLTPRGRAFGYGKTYGVPVKDYIAQSAEFTICA